MLSKNKYFFIISFVTLFNLACHDDDPSPIDDANANQWIYGVMSDIYLWEDQVPNRPNFEQTPEVFFDELKFSSDRFSILHPNYEDLVNSLNGIDLEGGYEFRVVREDDVVFAFITYVKPNSPASIIDLKRGDRISAINGTTLTPDNYRSILTSDLQNTHTIDFDRYDRLTLNYISQEQVLINTIQYSEDANFLDTIYTINDRKIGYYVYHFFANNSTLGAMDQIFETFRSNAITDLIIDLRYNSGGYILSSTNLASLVVDGANDQDIFYENLWNEIYQEIIENEQGGSEVLRKRFFSKSANIGSQIGGHIYVIVGSRTASASELFINGLLPFMRVTLIGEQTVGKNVGSIAIDDERNPGNVYGLLPIVFQSANADGNSDYDRGFVPEPRNSINEFDFPLLPLGDVQETLLSHAISIITGQISNARKSEPRPASYQMLMSSRDLKNYSGRTIQTLDK